MSGAGGASPKLAVVQFDAVSLPFVEQLIDKGRLPALAELRSSGEWIPLAGPAGYLEGSTATTLHTGLRPGEHGIYHPFQWSPDHQRLRLRQGISVPDAVWNRLGRAGRRSLLIDPYDSVRARSVEGIAVCGWQVTNRVTLPRWSSPSRIYGELSRRFGASSAADETFGGARLTELLRLRRVLLDAPGRVVEAARELLAKEPFDLVWIELVGAHLAGHQFWDVGRAIDVSKGTALERSALDTALADIYEATDRGLAGILEALPEDADVIVMAGSGMAAETDRSDLLPGMLAAILDGSSTVTSATRGGGALWSLRAALPVSVRAQIARVIPDRVALEIAARLSAAGTDWRRTRAFPVPNEPCGAVRLNVRGRELRGIVDPSEVDDLMREIEVGLLTFREPDGAAAVTAVERIDAIEPSGPRSHLLPDLSVRWSPRPSNGLRLVESPDFGQIRRVGNGSGRSGNHSGEGWALLAPARSRLRQLSRPAELVDVAATTCALLGADAEREALAGEPLLEPG